jgi:hypothetical protein
MSCDVIEERLDELLADRDWDDCNKGDAYDVLCELQVQRDSLREASRRLVEFLKARAAHSEEAKTALDYAMSFSPLADLMSPAEGKK